MRTSNRQRRPGFTMIEMIVVISIMLVLATLVVAVVGSPILVQDKARRGGDQLQLWFRIAKSRALADGAPRGIRLIADADGYARQVQYIEQPTDFIAMLPGNPPQPRPITILINPGPPQTIVAQLQGALPTGQYDFTGGLNVATPNDDPSWPVQGDKTVLSNGTTVPGDQVPPGVYIQSGDYLEVQGGGLLHRILNVFPDHLVLATAPPNLSPNGLGPTSQWRIVRGPRVLKGETPLLLPQDIVIDIRRCYPPPSASGSPDILFAPSGRVLGALGAQDRVVLWVRDVTLDSPYQNNPVLVSIHARTGFIAVHPVDTSSSPGSDFNFTKDGRLSGL